MRTTQSRPAQDVEHSANRTTLVVRFPAIAPFRAEGLYDGRFSPFLRSEQLQYILIGSEYSETS